MVKKVVFLRLNEQIIYTINVKYYRGRKNGGKYHKKREKESHGKRPWFYSLEA